MALFLTDTHAHIHMPPLSEDIEGVVLRAYEAGVKRIVTIGIDVDDSLEAIKVAERFDNVYCAIGVHPQDSEGFKDSDYSRFLEMGSNKKVLMVGEIGIDLFREPVVIEIQEAVFRKMLRLSLELSKPVAIHNREGSAECIRIMSQELKGSANGGILHCFDGNIDIMDWALDNGFYISYAGQVTYKTASNIRDTLKRVPLERIFIETDCPYLAPVPKRGKVNEPSYVVHTAEFIAGELGMDIGSFIGQLENNFITLFGRQL